MDRLYRVLKQYKWGLKNCHYYNEDATRELATKLQQLHGANIHHIGHSVLRAYNFTPKKETMLMLQLEPDYSLDILGWLEEGDEFCHIDDFMNDIFYEEYHG
jgi:hypothetical protein